MVRCRILGLRHFRGIVKPVAQPNKLYQLILSALLESAQTVRTELRGKRDVKGRWVEVAVDVPVPTLAGHVSELNVDRAAKRWIK